MELYKYNSSPVVARASMTKQYGDQSMLTCSSRIITAAWHTSKNMEPPQRWIAKQGNNYARNCHLVRRAVESCRSVLNADVQRVLRMPMPQRSLPRSYSCDIRIHVFVAELPAMDRLIVYLHVLYLRPIKRGRLRHGVLVCPGQR